MAKITISRNSGLPVVPGDTDRMLQEQNDFFDETEKRIGKYTDANFSEWEEALKKQDKLKEKYKFVDEVEMPNTKKAWKLLMEKYETQAIVLGKDEDDTLRLLIYDVRL